MITRECGCLLLVTTLALISAIVSAENNSTYEVLAPKSLRAGSKYGVTVTLYNYVTDVTVSLKLREVSSNTVLASAQLVISPANKGIAQQAMLEIPNQVPMTSYLLIAEGSGGLMFVQNNSVLVRSKTLSLFVQTDKSFYKPGQLIRLRAIVTKPDLKPFTGEMNITIYDQNDNKIVQWLNVKNSSGVVGRELQLSTQTPLGTWRIELRAMDNVFNKEFDVMEYVLPKFEVQVTLPSFYFINLNNRNLQKDLLILLTSKYTYGEPVKGTANIQIQIAKQWDTDPQRYPVISVDLELKDGKAETSVTLKQLLALVPLSWTPDDLWTMIVNRQVLVTAKVLETVTGITQEGNATVNCYDRRYKLDFLGISADSFQPGMVYNAYLQLTQADGTPPTASDIRLNETGELQYIRVDVSYIVDFMSTRDTDRRNVQITDSGFMTFTINIGSTNYSSVQLTATFFDAVANNTVEAIKTIYPFKSRGNEGIQITLANSNGVLMPDMDVTFNVKSTLPILRYSYVIMNKGTTVMSRTMTEASATTDHAFHLYLSSTLAQQLSPSASLLVWYTSDSAEVIASSLEVKVDGAFANKVSITFDKEKVAPAGTVSVIVNAYQNSLCGILAVDQSVLLIKSGNDITQQMVRDDLDQYSRNDGSTFNPGPMPMGGPIGGPIGDPIAKRRKRSIGLWWWPYFPGGTDTYTLIDNVGLFMMTDAYVHRAQKNGWWPPIGPPGCADCPVAMPGAPGAPGNGGPAGPQGQGPAGQPGTNGQEGSGGLVEPVKTRATFPETWLWTDMAIGPNNTTSMVATVPDTITSWVASAFAMSSDVGLGISDTAAKLTVFQPFFASLTLPYSIIRGEHFALKVTVFNYMPENMQVRVTLVKSTEFFVKVENAIEPQSMEAVSTINVASNDASTAYFWIVAQKLGNIEIEVKVQSNMAADAVKQTLLVRPEGVEQSYSSSAFIQLTGNGSEYNSEFTVSLPPVGVLVPDSQYIECSLIGDLMGPAAQGLDSLLQMPYGCGEQNMLTLAPDVYIVNYLTAVNLAAPEIMQKAKSYMLAGYQRELTYQRKDGSFSAFGESDMSGSTWLSSFVVRVFHQAKDEIPVEDAKIAVTLKWICNQQTRNGSFAEPGRVIHTDMQGGSSQGVAMSAYVLTALLENQDNKIINASVSTAIVKAVKYLEDQLPSIRNDSYSLAIVAYALTLAGSLKANEARDTLMSLAISKDGMIYWQKSEPESQDSVVGENGEAVMWRPPYRPTSSSNIEIASYALLTFSKIKNITAGWPIAKWLISKRNSNGGFVSTQDTCVGLEALASFAAMTGGPSDGSGMNVTVTAGLAVSRFQSLNKLTALLLQKFEIPGDQTVIKVKATGMGTALVQLNVKYNTYSVSNDNPIKLTVNTTYGQNQVTVTSCGRYMGKDESGMVVMEVKQPTGYNLVNMEDIRKNNDVMRVDSDSEKTILYFNELNEKGVCVVLVSQKSMIVENVQNATIKLYTYYNPDQQETKLYAAQQNGSFNMCQSCPQCCVCGNNSFTCGDGSCRPANASCNGVNDCADGSDEMNCTIVANTSSTTAMLEQNMNTSLSSMAPVLSGSSVPSSQSSSVPGSPPVIVPGSTTIAPSGPGSPGSSTSSPVIIGSPTPLLGFQACSSMTFNCSVGVCVAMSAKCNNHIDCPDGTDESNCPAICQTGKTFKCNNGQCVSDSLRCDKKQDCYDGSDEFKCAGSPLIGETKDVASRPVLTLSLTILATACTLLLSVIQ